MRIVITHPFVTIIPTCLGRVVSVIAGIVAINATIRKDNTGGIAYYIKMGFEIYALARDVTMLDGTKIDRISKRLLLDEIDD